MGGASHGPHRHSPHCQKPHHAPPNPHWTTPDPTGQDGPTPTRSREKGHALQSGNRGRLKCGARLRGWRQRREVTGRKGGDKWEWRGGGWNAKRHWQIQNVLRAQYHKFVLIKKSVGFCFLTPQWCFILKLFEWKMRSFWHWRRNGAGQGEGGTTARNFRHLWWK